MKKTIIFILIAILSACAPKSEICGTYKGLMPAASGPGIDITLQINMNGTFKRKLVYVGEKDGTFLESGRYTVSGSLLTLETDNEISYYRKEKNGLLLLDYRRQRITGALAEHYLLTKIKDCAGKKQ